MSDRHFVYISVGSNMGDRLQNCRRGIKALTHQSKSRVLAQSRIYSTEPVDFLDQDWFINMMIKLETELDPFQLLDQIKSIQRAAGRKQDIIQYGPRIL
ncbi:MAG: 2-amino-4-hydroxy-6-hydroxymethyldihydropteridine diphosphokinase, partial [Desulfobacterales bacterium]